MTTEQLIKEIFANPYSVKIYLDAIKNLASIRGNMLVYLKTGGSFDGELFKQMEQVESEYLNLISSGT